MPRTGSTRRADVRRWRVCAAFLFACLSLRAQVNSARGPSAQELQELANRQQWQTMVDRLATVHPRTAEMDYYDGMALAQLKRWSEATRVLEAGRRLAPADARFPTELGGIAFQQKNYPLAARRLRQALRLAPQDAYANDFLATVYFLEGNLEAALRYWNRVDKPQIAAVREEPTPRVDAALLDHAFAFAPASTLTLAQLADTEARLRGLGIFPQFHIDLNAKTDGTFDAVFRARELNGLGDSRWEAAFLLLRGLPFQQADPEYENLHREAVNISTLFRWDAQKRRIFAQASGPFEHSAQHRWELTADLRNENWAVRNGFAGAAPVLASMNMRTERASFALASHGSDRLGWRAGAEISHRCFRSVAAGTVLTPQMLDAGYQLKQIAQYTGTVWRVPERRFTLKAQAASEAARLWSHNAESFEKLTGMLGWHWLPQARGDDYETQQQLRAGRIFGQAPFDELFILGLERDNDLPMRAHIGTRDGRKGSAPLGRAYFLENWELDKNVWGNGLMQIRLGPFADIGTISDSGTQLGSHMWLFDSGAQLKFRVFGTGLIFSYGKDLRTGKNAFYLRLLE